jgi:hypothetical protein
MLKSDERVVCRYSCLRVGPTSLRLEDAATGIACLISCKNKDVMTYIFLPPSSIPPLPLLLPPPSPLLSPSPSSSFLSSSFSSLSSLSPPSPTFLVLSLALSSPFLLSLPSPLPLSLSPSSPPLFPLPPSLFPSLPPPPSLPFSFPPSFLHSPPLLPSSPPSLPPRSMRVYACPHKQARGGGKMPSRKETRWAFSDVAQTLQRALICPLTRTRITMMCSLLSTSLGREGGLFKAKR